mmetsp:Transcript_88210/g.251938  ORF Transcript_88210/g.251938 Transcript_88210/m.251938 type:complete len:157 (+) Transcript_88210:1687-2157(+)
MAGGAEREAVAAAAMILRPKRGGPRGLRRGKAAWPLMSKCPEHFMRPPTPNPFRHKMLTMHIRDVRSRYDDEFEDEDDPEDEFEDDEEELPVANSALIHEAKGLGPLEIPDQAPSYGGRAPTTPTMRDPRPVRQAAKTPPNHLIHHPPTHPPSTHS